MNDHKKSCSIVVPVYNESTVVEATVNRLKKTALELPNWIFEIICIDDGSTDGSAEVLSRCEGIRIFSHEVNRGYGAALRTGLRHSRHEWIFIVDADATYPIEDLGRLLREVDDGADMVVGAREGIGINLSPLRRFARWTLRKMAHALTGVMVPDLNSGMRVFKHQLYRECSNLLPLGFSFTTTITLAALYTNHRIRYVPIRYAQRVGQSSIRPVRDFFAFLILILRIASYFEPLRFFLPVALGMMGLGFLKGTIDFVRLGAIGALAVIMFLMGVQVFVLGLIAEVIVRRSPSAIEQSSMIEGRRGA